MRSVGAMLRGEAGALDLGDDVGNLLVRGGEVGGAGTCHLIDRLIDKKCLCNDYRDYSRMDGADSLSRPVIARVSLVFAGERKVRAARGPAGLFALGAMEEGG